MKNKFKEYLEEHFFYELEMLYLAYSTMKAYKLNQYQLNLVLESYLIHLRCLLEFYYSKKTYPDDAKAEQFISAVEDWNKVRKTKSYMISNKDADRLNQELAHLTWNRIAGKPAEKSWDEVMNETYPKIIEITDIFLANLKPNIHLEKIPRLIEQMKLLLK